MLLNDQTQHPSDQHLMFLKARLQRKYTESVKGIELFLILVPGHYTINLLNVGRSTFQRTVVFFQLPSAFFFLLTPTGTRSKRRRQEPISLDFDSCNTIMYILSWDMHLQSNEKRFPPHSLGLEQSAVLHPLS